MNAKVDLLSVCKSLTTSEKLHRFFSFPVLDLKSLFKRLIVCKHVVHGWLVLPNTYKRTFEIKNVAKSTQSNILPIFDHLSWFFQKMFKKRGDKKNAVVVICCLANDLTQQNYWYNNNNVLLLREMRKRSAAKAMIVTLLKAFPIIGSRKNHLLFHLWLHLRF